MKYYMHIGGQQVGPYEENELPSHGLTASTMVWREGMPDWVAASEAAKKWAIWSAVAGVVISIIVIVLQIVGIGLLGTAALAGSDF